MKEKTWKEFLEELSLDWTARRDGIERVSVKRVLGGGIKYQKIGTSYVIKDSYGDCDTHVRGKIPPIWVMYVRKNYAGMYFSRVEAIKAYKKAKKAEEESERWEKRAWEKAEEKDRKKTEEEDRKNYFLKGGEK